MPDAGFSKRVNETDTVPFDAGEGLAEEQQ